MPAVVDNRTRISKRSRAAVMTVGRRGKVCVGTRIRKRFATSQNDPATVERPGAGVEHIPPAASAPAALPDPKPIAAEFRIIRKEEEGEQRTVFGIVLEPETFDSQNDIESVEEIAKTAWRFLEEYQQFGHMHKSLVPGINVMESFLAPVDFSMEADGEDDPVEIKKGTWLLRARVLDAVIWDGVKSGDLTGFSIGGTAIRTPETTPGSESAAA